MGKLKKTLHFFILIELALLDKKNVHRSGEFEKDSSRLKILPKQVIKNYLPPHSLKIDTVPLQRFSFKGFIGHKRGYILTPNDHYFFKKEQKKPKIEFQCKKDTAFLIFIECVPN